MGLLLTLAGTVGSVVCGIILDKTHLFKMTTLVLYLLSLIGMAFFTGAVYLPTVWPLYFVSAFLGFFMTGYGRENTDDLEDLYWILLGANFRVLTS